MQLFAPGGKDGSATDAKNAENNPLFSNHHIPSTFSALSKVRC